MRINGRVVKCKIRTEVATVGISGQEMTIRLRLQEPINPYDANLLQEDRGYPVTLTCVPRCAHPKWRITECGTWTPTGECPECGAVGPLMFWPVTHIPIPRNQQTRCESGL